ncbi:MAG TPA: hypothetical protein VNG33_14270 [Polyangiaceae bacterium]|nr:hypothetical protein [Polyangiaceae bacterium]
MKRALWFAPLALLVLGCSGEGNDGQPNRNFSWCKVPHEAGTACPDAADGSSNVVNLWDQIPWANHATPQLNGDGTVKISDVPVFPPIPSVSGLARCDPASSPGDPDACLATDTPDPGSHPVDCSALADIELSPYYVDNFEPLGGEVGMAPGWSNYDDGTDGSFRTPGDVDWYPGLAGKYGSSPYGLAADRQVGERPMCQLDAMGQPLPNDWALHYRGGRYNYYGGGMAHPFAAPRDGNLMGGPPAGSDLCPCRDGTGGCAPGDRVCGSEPTDVFVPPAGGSFDLAHLYYDASAYDGIVFWARRGPAGATGLLVGLQDKYTSDDLARQNQKFCKRLKVCVPGCVNGYECIKQDDADVNGEEIGLFRCMPPKMDVTKVINPALRDFLFPHCGPSTCKPPAFFPDKDLEGTECTAFAFTGNDEGYWCADKDRPVAPWAERCGDAFVSAISLSTDWQLYKLPFDSFRQVGFGKPAPSFDLKSLYSIAFQFTVGYTDVYVDNLSFYRKK